MDEHRRPWLLLAAASIAVLLLTAAWARAGQPSAIETATFRSVNEAPSWLYQLLWPVMQLGNVVVAGAVAVVVGLVLRRWPVAVAGAAACVAAWYLAKVVKDRVGRGRPVALLHDVRLPGIDESGFGFISGHSTVAFTLATIVAGALPRRWRAVPFALATIVAVARVYMGVHLPLDVIGGAAAGIALGSLVNVALIRPADQSVATSPTGQATPVPPKPQ